MILPFLAAAVLHVSGVNPDAELLGEVEPENLTSTQGQLAAAMVKKKDVTLRITSPGGNGLALLVFIQQVEDMKARQHARIHCVADIMAASAAAILLESSVCDTRASTERTVILFHGVSTQVQGKIGQMEDDLKLYKDLDLVMAQIVGPRMGLTPAQYLAKIDRRDWWLTPQEALDNHALDEVLTPVQAFAAPPPAPKAEAQKVEPPAPAPACLPDSLQKAPQKALAWLRNVARWLGDHPWAPNALVALMASWALYSLGKRPRPSAVPLARKAQNPRTSRRARPRA